MSRKQAIECVERMQRLIKCTQLLLEGELQDFQRNTDNLLDSFCSMADFSTLNLRSVQRNFNELHNLRQEVRDLFRKNPELRREVRDYAGGVSCV